MAQSQVPTAETETVLGFTSQATFPGDGRFTDSSLSLSDSTSDTSGSKLDSADSGDNMSLASELDSDHDAGSSTWGEVSGTHSQACHLWLWVANSLLSAANISSGITASVLQTLMTQMLMLITLGTIQPLISY